MDSHHVLRYVTADGDVQNEGDVQVGKFRPTRFLQVHAPAPGRVREHLLVPECLSASHNATAPSA
jgi:hypothetical protein